METEKYIGIWTRYLPIIKILIKKSVEKKEVLEMNKIDFASVGDRKSSGYSFNIIIENGKVKMI